MLQKRTNHNDLGETIKWENWLWKWQKPKDPMDRTKMRWKDCEEEKDAR